MRPADSELLYEEPMRPSAFFLKKKLLARFCKRALTLNLPLNSILS
jgi:hypothetical protein